MHTCQNSDSRQPGSCAPATSHTMVNQQSAMRSCTPHAPLHLHPSPHPPLGCIRALVGSVGRLAQLRKLRLVLGCQRCSLRRQAGRRLRQLRACRGGSRLCHAGTHLGFRHRTLQEQQAGAAAARMSTACPSPATAEQSVQPAAQCQPHNTASSSSSTSSSVSHLQLIPHDVACRPQLGLLGLEQRVRPRLVVPQLRLQLAAVLLKQHRNTSF